jgi:hypothetical protein
MNSFEVNLKSLNADTVIRNYTDAEKSTLTNIVMGTIINVIDDGLYYFDGSTWKKVGSGTIGVSGVSGVSSYNDLTNKPLIPSKVSELTNDSSFQTLTDISTLISNKVDKVSGKQLSTEDYSTVEKN